MCEYALVIGFYLMHVCFDIFSCFFVFATFYLLPDAAVMCAEVGFRGWDGKSC